MAASHSPLVVALLAVPESTASTLYGMYELLESAGRDWGSITQGAPGESQIRPMIVSADGKEFQAANGLWIEPTHRLDGCPAPHVVAVPDLAVMPAEDIGGRYAREVEWLKRLDDAGCSTGITWVSSRSQC